MIASKENINYIENELNSIGLLSNIEDINKGYTTTTLTLSLMQAYNPTFIKRAVKTLEIAVGEDITYNDKIGQGNTITITINNTEKSYPLFIDNAINVLKDKPIGEMLIGIADGNIPITMNIQDTLSILVAGATGSGKSVCLNNLIMSLGCYSPPTELGIMLIDLKRNEFSIYDNRLPQLICPVIYDFTTALKRLKQVNDIIDDRYIYLQHEHKRKADTKECPIIVVIIDEYAQLILTSGNSKTLIDKYINKIVNVGRACNVFAIISTQNPVSSVINSTIKYGCQSKIALAVNNIRHSINIIDNKKATELNGNGDCLFYNPTSNIGQRLQVCNITEEEIDEILD